MIGANAFGWAYFGQGYSGVTGAAPPGVFLPAANERTLVSTAPVLAIASNAPARRVTSRNPVRTVERTQ